MADKNQVPTVAKAFDKKKHSFQLSFVRVSQPLAVFTLETDGPSETGFEDGLTAVSYTHLTLPTIYSV